MWSTSFIWLTVDRNRKLQASAMSSCKRPRSDEDQQESSDVSSRDGGNRQRQATSSATVASAVGPERELADTIPMFLVKKMVLSRILELQHREKKLENDRSQLKLLWRAHIANVMEVRDALNDAYAMAAMISAEITNVSCTQDFNSYAEMLYNRLNGDESELLARWQGFESLGN